MLRGWNHQPCQLYKLIFLDVLDPKSSSCSQMQPFFPAKKSLGGFQCHTRPLSGASVGPDQSHCGGSFVYPHLPAGLFASLTSMSHFRRQLFLPPGMLLSFHPPPPFLGLFGWLIILDTTDTGAFSLNQSGSGKAQLSSQRHCSPQL